MFAFIVKYVFIVNMDVRVYPGKYQKPYFSEDFNAKVIYNSDQIKRPNKTVAFDLDESLGQFSDLYILWNRISTSNRNQSTFNSLLDIYPEFLRTGIFSVLRFVQTKIKNGECHPIYIYTNNQCGTEWVEFIVSYFELKTGVQFARPICAYKIGTMIVEPNRTTHDKNYSDFVQCSMLQPPFEMCFIDDRKYTSMIRSKVYYIQPPPYFHQLSLFEIDARFTHFVSSNNLSILNTVDARRIKGQDPKIRSYSTEQQITNKIMYYLREFFLMNLLRSGRSRTKKRRKGVGTRKRRS
jgi:hypothetical protein